MGRDAGVAVGVGRGGCGEWCGGGLLQPFVQVGGDEDVVGEFRVGLSDAMDFGLLPWGERFVLVEAPDAVEKALLAEYLMDTGDAATELIGGVEDGSVGLGEARTEGE